MKRIAALLILAVALNSICNGDMLHFKSGKSYSCQVLAFSNSTFTVLLDGRTLQAPAVTIDRITFSSAEDDKNPAAKTILSSYEFEEEAKYTPGTYLESYLGNRELEEATISCTPKDLLEKIFTIENTPIKLVFSRRSKIEQIGTNEYTVSVYGDDFESVTVYFDEDGLRYIRSVKEGYGYKEAKRIFALYGIALSSKTLETFQSKYRWGRPVFLPMGKSTIRRMGNQPVEFRW